MENKIIQFSPKAIWEQGKSSVYTEETSLNEYVANSIDGIKKRIEVLGKDLPEKTIRIDFMDGEVIIKDNGIGMDIDEVNDLFFSVSSSKKSTSSSLFGNFGVGAKYAFTFLARKNGNQKMEVITHKEGQKPVRAIWSPNEEVANEYLIGYCEKEVEIGTEVHLFISKKFDVEDYIIKSQQNYWEIIDSGYNMIINGRSICPNDPLYRKNKNVLENNRFNEKKFKVKGETVTISYTSFYSEDDIPSLEKNPFDATNDSTIMATNTSGVYLKSCGQYFARGGNFSALLGTVNHTDCNGLRIEIDIPKPLWGIIGMTYNKNGIVKSLNKIDEFKEIFDFIKEICDIFKAKKFTGNKERKTDTSIKNSMMKVSPSIKSVNYDTSINELIAVDDKENVILNPDKINYDNFNKHQLGGIFGSFVEIRKWFDEDNTLYLNDFINRFEKCYGKTTF